MTKNQKLAYACHEAGHAVATNLLPERTTKSVTIIPNKAANSLGMNTHEYPDWVTSKELQKLEPRALAWILDTIVTGYAGAEAERLCLGRYNRKGSSDDGEDIYLLSQHLCGVDDDPERKALLHWLKLRARSLVRKNWHLIAATAEALLEHGTLSEAQVEEVIHKAKFERRVELLEMYRHPKLRWRS